VTIAEGLAQLGIKRLLLAIHDPSFPSDPDEDLGRGAPTTRAAFRLLAMVRAMGFTGLQLGPQGQTARDNPSPYDGTIFSRHLGNVSAAAWAEVVGERAVQAQLLRAPGGSARHAHAHDAAQALLEAAFATLPGNRVLAARLATMRAKKATWLARDRGYEALCHANGGAGFQAWTVHDAPLDDARQRIIERFELGQMLAHEELARMRREAQRLGLLLYGDLQVGYSDRDAWAFQDLFLRDYRMGAPPSRTNPEGQPWGYPVLDPDQLGGAGRAFVVARAAKAFAEYDSLRIDHPHGLVCPWVYTDDVQRGARLFDSPDLADHPALARFAIARPDQLDRSLPRYADGWVRELSPAQIDRYARVFDALIGEARAHGRSPDDLSCEVLSTLPRPLADVLARHGLGRWRILQKANLDDPGDVYRSENAEPRDWIMLGNHDTAPIMALIATWPPGKREAWARHLAARLCLARPERLASPGYLATCMLAECFASRAQNVSVFFADLFGFTERFNLPGVISADNWTLRLPHDFEALHAERVHAGLAPDLALAVQLALAVRA
jgi:4-alpha-glucanotransferase